MYKKHIDGVITLWIYRKANRYKISRVLFCRQGCSVNREPVVGWCDRISGVEFTSRLVHLCKRPEQKLSTETADPKAAHDCYQNGG